MRIHSVAKRVTATARMIRTRTISMDIPDAGGEKDLVPSRPVKSTV
jgi:hypothetical protein